MVGSGNVQSDGTMNVRCGEDTSTMAVPAPAITWRGWRWRGWYMEMERHDGDGGDGDGDGWSAAVRSPFVRCVVRSYVGMICAFVCASVSVQNLLCV